VSELELIAAVGAAVSAVASAISAWLAVRMMRRNMREDCDKRLEAFRQGLELGRDR
jgi:hypothetical protein